LPPRRRLVYLGIWLGWREEIVLSMRRLLLALRDARILVLSFRMGSSQSCFPLVAFLIPNQFAAICALVNVDLPALFILRKGTSKMRRGFAALTDELPTRQWGVCVLIRELHLALIPDRDRALRPVGDKSKTRRRRN
jgi:hypothetical protein